MLKLCAVTQIIYLLFIVAVAIIKYATLISHFVYSADALPQHTTLLIVDRKNKANEHTQTELSFNQKTRLNIEVEFPTLIVVVVGMCFYGMKLN